MPRRAAKDFAVRLIFRRDTLDFWLRRLTEGGLVVSPNENNRRADAVRKMLVTAPKAGTNTILVTHYPNIIAVPQADLCTAAINPKLRTGTV
jgi:predicted ATPase